jgi:peptidoglycan hydrolase-like protein with peptidoglycan-binding domain
MKKLAIALLATAAFGLPAMAQNANAPKAQPPQSQTQQPSQPMPMQPTAQAQPSKPQQTAQNQQSQQPIAAKDLSKSDIRQVQTALNKDGFKVGRIDGLWGHETSSAVRQFQKNKGLQANGQIDQMTVADLGLNSAQFAPQHQGGK